MICPFWTDNDANYGKVFYHIYHKNTLLKTNLEHERTKVC